MKEEVAHGLSAWRRNIYIHSRAARKRVGRKSGTRSVREKLRAVGSRETFDALKRNRTFHCYFCTFLSDDMVDAQPPSSPNVWRK